MKHARWMQWMMAMVLLAAPSVALADELPEPPPPADNAAVWYLTAQYYLLSTDSEEKRALLEKYRDPDLEAARKYVKQSDALIVLRRGATLEQCGWAVDLKADGPNALLPHLSMMREMSRLMAVSGRVQLEDGNADGAISDWTAMMRMARHSADDGTLIGCLVQHAIDRTALEVIADHLHRLDRKELETLDQHLADLPKRFTVQDAIAGEAMIGHWLRREYKTLGLEGFINLVGEVDKDLFKGIKPEQRDEKMQQWLDELDASYIRIYGILGLEGEAFAKANAQYEEEIVASKNPLIRILMPAIGGARTAERRAQTLHQMLRAMNAYRLGGDDAFNAVVDSADDKPFDRKQTEAGLVVSSRMQYRDKALSLTFNSEAAKPLD